MPRVKRLRWTDWLGLVGLVMLLAWTPGYVAQDETEKRLTGGETFTLPMPRDGDRAVLDLVVTHADGTTQRYERVAELVFDTVPVPETELVGVPTAGRFGILYHETNASLGMASYLSPESMRAWWFDEQGFVVWQHQQGIHQWGRHVELHDSAAALHGTLQSGCGTLDAPQDYAGQTLRYDTHPLADLLASLRDPPFNQQQSDPCGRSGGAGHLRVVNRAFDSEAGQLYGRHLLRSDRLVDKMTQDADAPYTMCPFEKGHPVFTNNYGSKYFGSHDQFSLRFNDVLVYTEDIASTCDYRDHVERWDWISPDFPIPVGHHVRHHDADGRLLFQVDLIPSRIERGDGAPIPVVPRPDGRALNEATPPDSPRPITLALADIEHEPSLRLMNRTLADAATIVRTRADGALAQFLDKDAHVVAFTAVTNGSAVQTGQRSSVWILTFAHATGEVRTAMLTAGWSAPPSLTTPAGPLPVVEETPLPQPAAAWTYQVNDACTSPDYYVPGTKYCGSVNPKRVAPHRQVVAMDDLLADIDAFVGAGAGTLRDPGRDTFARLDFDAINTTQAPHPDGYMAEVDQSTLRWSLSHTDAAGHLVYQAHGTHDLDTGTAQTISRARTVVSGEPGPDPIPLTAASREEYRILPLTPVGAALAWSGIGLLLVALAARLLAALKSGSVPIFAAGLYAKIRNEDVLLHDRRDAIAAALRADPGLTAKELAKRLDAGWGATVHHLETLRRAGLVTRIVVGRNRHHFLAKESSVTARRLVALRRDPAYAAFLDAVVKEPGRSLDEIAATLPRSMSGLSRTGSRLAREGVVEKRKEGRTVRFYPVANP